MKEKLMILKISANCFIVRGMEDFLMRKKWLIDLLKKTALSRKVTLLSLKGHHKSESPL